MSEASAAAERHHAALVDLLTEQVYDEDEEFEVSSDEEFEVSSDEEFEVSSEQHEEFDSYCYESNAVISPPRKLFCSEIRPERRLFSAVQRLQFAEEAASAQAAGCKSYCAFAARLARPADCESVRKYVSKWLKDIDRLRAEAKASRTHMHGHRPAPFEKAELKLHERYREFRAEGDKVTGHWLKIAMKEELHKLGEKYGAGFKASGKWLFNFCRRHGISYKRRTNTKTQDVMLRLDKICKWWKQLHEIVLPSTARTVVQRYYRDGSFINALEQSIADRGLTDRDLQTDRSALKKQHLSELFDHVAPVAVAMGDLNLAEAQTEVETDFGCSFDQYGELLWLSRKYVNKLEDISKSKVGRKAKKPRKISLLEQIKNLAVRAKNEHGMLSLEEVKISKMVPETTDLDRTECEQKIQQAVLDSKDPKVLKKNLKNLLDSCSKVSLSVREEVVQKLLCLAVDESKSGFSMAILTKLLALKMWTEKKHAWLNPLRALCTAVKTTEHMDTPQLLKLLAEHRSTSLLLADTENFEDYSIDDVKTCISECIQTWSAIHSDAIRAREQIPNLVTQTLRSKFVERHQCAWERWYAPACFWSIARRGPYTEHLTESERIWGRFKLEHRYNMDQVPLPFVDPGAYTYADKGKRRTWIKKHHESDDDRLCTMQLCISACHTQTVRACLIFRGSLQMNLDSKSKKPKNSPEGTPPEAELYHEDVVCYFNETAWATPEFSRWWALNVWNADTCWKDQKLLICDNLQGQTAKRPDTLVEPGSFVGDIAKSNTILWNLPPNATDEIQPVDAGYGKQVRHMVRRNFDEWLLGKFTVPNILDPGDSAIDCWHRPDKLPIWKKRVLITHFVANAVRDVNTQSTRGTSEHVAGSYVLRCFERTGMAMSLDRHNDDKIRLEGCPATFGEGADIDYLTPNRVEYATNHRGDLWEIACEKGTLDISSDDECEVMSSDEEDFQKF